MPLPTAHPCILALVILALGGLPAARAQDAKLLLRCTGYLARVAALPGSAGTEAHAPADPFDIAIEAGRGKGWFRGIAVSEARPGRVVTDPSTYRVKWRGSWGGTTMTEWVLVDRIEGSFVGHFTHVDGEAVERHRWGGACVAVPRRF
jgi:hypothetical protein